jgi:uncharacterized lipoprotein YajG
MRHLPGTVLFILFAVSLFAGVCKISEAMLAFDPHATMDSIASKVNATAEAHEDF